jgi:hypothetical protein
VDEILDNGNDDSFAGTQTAVVSIELAKDGKTLTTTTTTEILMRTVR